MASEDTVRLLSDAALAIFKPLNPYTHRVYDYKKAGDIETLLKVSQEILKPVTIRLGEAILAADPNAMVLEDMSVATSVHNLKKSH